MKPQITVLILLLFIVIGCNATKKTNENGSPDSQASTMTITDMTWELIQLEGTVVDQSATSGEKIYFILNSIDNKVSGYAGCNTFLGNYTLEKGNRIRFSQLANTRMACPDAAIDEKEVLEIFKLADNYTVNDGTLMLNVGRRAPLAIFRTVSPEEQIVEKYWKLKILDGQEVKMVENQEREIYFILKTDENRVTGFAGCNTFSGVYTLESGGRIRFSQMATTMKVCPGVNVNEVELLKMFELADNYTIQKNILSLNVGRRAPLAVFEVVYFN